MDEHNVQELVIHACSKKTKDIIGILMTLWNDITKQRSIYQWHFKRVLAYRPDL